MSDEGGQAVIQEADARPTHAASSWFDRTLWLGARVAEAQAAAFRSGQPGHEHYLMALQIQETTTKIEHGDHGCWVTLMLNSIVVGD